jgi:putative transposase
VHDDHVQRDFTAQRPDHVWVTDITEHPTAGIQAAGGKLYGCAIKDVFSNRIVGYVLDERMTAQLAVTALRAPSPGGSGPASWWSTAITSPKSEQDHPVLTAAGLQGPMGRVSPPPATAPL